MQLLAQRRYKSVIKDQDARVGDSLDEERSFGLSLACITSAGVLRSSCVCLACYVSLQVDGRIFLLLQGQQLDNRVCLFVNLALWEEFPVQEVLHCTKQAHIVYKQQTQVVVTLRVDSPRHLVQHAVLQTDCPKIVPDFVRLWYDKGRGRPKTRQDIQLIVS